METPSQVANHAPDLGVSDMVEVMESSLCPMIRHCPSPSKSCSAVVLGLFGEMVHCARCPPFPPQSLS